MSLPSSEICFLAASHRFLLLLLIFDPKQRDCRPPLTHSHYFHLFPRLKLKLKGLYFDTVEVIEAESQAVLNALTEHDFQDAFQNMAEALGTVHMRGKRLLRR
jgi:hypothetical protein